MKIILAPDKFKGSLNGLEFCDAVSNAILAIIPSATIINCPLADGGDGTIDIVKYYLGGELINVNVNSPLFKKVEATYLYAANSRTAFIEMAEASGFKLLTKEELDCKNTTTLGTGEMIIDAINSGAEKIILGIGGSATNDCGIGMAKALGYRFFDYKDVEVYPVGKNLSKIVRIDDSQVYSKLKYVEIKVACDVTNPLYGKNGAAFTYAPQKGATQKEVKLLDNGLKNFAAVLDEHFNIDSQSVKGAGAAGGMGIGTMTFLNAELIPGIDLIKGLAKFTDKIKGANWVITGEGQLDEQTLSGKTINGVISDAKNKDIRVAAFCGKIELSEKDLKAFGISYADEVMKYANNYKDAIKNSQGYVVKMAKKFAKNLT